MTGKICCLCGRSPDPDPDQEWPSGLSVCFVDGTQQVGKQRMYKDHDEVFDILRPAQAQQEDHQAGEWALRGRRPGSVELNLTQQQYEKLKGGK
jgi:hypothetical protein